MPRSRRSSGPALTIVWWRAIPSQIIAKSGETEVKHQLAERFQEAIDVAAMRGGAAEDGAYLADWRREARPLAEGEDPQARVDAEVARIEAAYDDARLKLLMKHGGHEPDGDAGATADEATGG